MSRIALIDVETTGLESSFHEIIDIGCVIFDSESLKVLDTLDLKVKPKHPERADAKAVEVNGYNDEEWKDTMSLELAMALLKARTEGATFCAHNMIFDWGFLRTAMAKTGIRLDFDRHRIDLFSLAWAKIPHGSMQGWSLRSICTYLRIIPEPKLHRGLQGAMKEYEVYCKLMSIHA